MQINATAGRERSRTHEGGPAANLSAEQKLRRSVLACLLWEGEFYEDGVSIAERVAELCEHVPPEAIAFLAIDARHRYHLRHVPLLLLKCLSKRGGGRLVRETADAVIQRPDELSEFLAIYWADGRRPISNPLKRGLAKAFTKFSAYQLAKYNRDKAVKLRDVMFLVHPKPRDAEQAATWKALADGTLSPPDTWEVSLSSGADKKETFERLLRENKLGYLALLRNLRNMVEAGCDEQLVRAAILSRRGAERVLPFRYVAAARACPQLEPAIDTALLATIAEMQPLPGRTIILVDVSGSMDGPLSAKSDLTRMDAAATLASIVGGDVRVLTFSNSLVEVPPRRGMAGVDAIVGSQSHGGTYLGRAVADVNNMPHDRLIVITDEQSSDHVPPPSCRRAYMINVASYERGVGHSGHWTRISGFSEQVLRFIAEHESE